MTDKFIEKSLYGHKIEPVTIDEFMDSLESILDRDFGEAWDCRWDVNDGWVNISLNVPYNESPDAHFGSTGEILNSQSLEVATDDRDHYRKRCSVETCEYCKENN